MTRRFLIPLVVLALGWSTAACGSDTDTAGTTTVAGSASPSASATRLDPEAGLALLTERGDLTVIDVRTPAEFAAAHLEGAVNIDVQAPDFDDRITELGLDGGYAVYCHSGRRSALAAARMGGLGFTDVHDLGGIEAWMAAGNPVVTG
jgi:phage shock protein E